MNSRRPPALLDASVSAQPTAIIGEDEKALAQELAEMLCALWPALRIVGVVHSGGDALGLIADHRPNIAFLDIRMPGLSGLDVAQQVISGGVPTRIVFVTAHDEHALEAFDARAIDYVLKPIKPDRLQETINRLKAAPALTPSTALDENLLAALQQVAQSRPRKYLRWINCGQGQEIDVISISEVLFFQARDKYTCVVTAEKERYIRTSIKELLNALDPDEFWQVHRASIIRVAALERAVKDEIGKLQLKLHGCNQLVPVSQAFAGRFRQM